MNAQCKICGAATSEFHDKQFGINYYHCQVCNFISKDQRSIISAEEEKREYDLHNNSWEDQGYVQMFRDFLNQTEPYKSGGIKALDFGSGPQPILAELLTKEYGYETDIYDLFYSPEKIYLDKKYDLITCTEVVEHLIDPLAAFRLFKELLAENGIVSVMTLFHPKDDEKFCRWFYRREKSHISFFTPKTMETIANLVNLKIVYVDNKRQCIFKNAY